eukprot:Clim_evm7s141 gene=Clim_evmTU7s141
MKESLHFLVFSILAMAIVLVQVQGEDPDLPELPEAWIAEVEANILQNGYNVIGREAYSTSNQVYRSDFVGADGTAISLIEYGDTSPYHPYPEYLNLAQTGDNDGFKFAGRLMVVTYNRHAHAESENADNEVMRSCNATFPVRDFFADPNNSQEGHLRRTSDILRFGAQFQETYDGTDTVRGIPTNKWTSPIVYNYTNSDGQQVQIDATLEYHFVDSEDFTPANHFWNDPTPNKSTPVLARLTGTRKVGDDTPPDMEHEYHYTAFFDEEPSRYRFNHVALCDPEACDPTGQPDDYSCPCFLTYEPSRCGESEDKSIPALPRQFSAVAEANIRGEYSVVQEELYDEPNQVSARRTIAPFHSQRLVLEYGDDSPYHPHPDQANNEWDGYILRFSVEDTGDLDAALQNCNISLIARDFFSSSNGEAGHIQGVSDLFRIPAQGVRYLGRDTVRGIPSEKWTWPVEFSFNPHGGDVVIQFNYTVDIWFNEEGYEIAEAESSGSMDQVPVQMTVVGSRKRSTESSGVSEVFDFSHHYEWVSFASGQPAEGNFRGLTVADPSACGPDTPEGCSCSIDRNSGGALAAQQTGASSSGSDDSTDVGLVVGMTFVGLAVGAAVATGATWYTWRRDPMKRASVNNPNGWSDNIPLARASSLSEAL